MLEKRSLRRQDYLQELVLDVRIKYLVSEVRQKKMWYIQHLLKNRLEIRTNGDIESDEFNDLIIIEKKIKSLYMADIISRNVRPDRGSGLFSVRRLRIFSQARRNRQDGAPQERDMVASFLPVLTAFEKSSLAERQPLPVSSRSLALPSSWPGIT